MKASLGRLKRKGKGRKWRQNERASSFKRKGPEVLFLTEVWGAEEVLSVSLAQSRP